ncbi:hypothetical protein [Oceaniglobus trochenteri]|uniref:hypothetical protein n=1 Tax=Oceaniglobus trochenteri TaxID=2763260 RepID=UPI001D0012FF|nr:hypothetical protein [Oceaniglobus trochenteri]
MARGSLMAVVALSAALAGCAGYPDLGESPAAARAEYPRLVPLTGLLATAQTGQLTDPTLSRDLAGRAARLRARAAAMRRAALTDQDRSRIREAVLRYGG